MNGNGTPRRLGNGRRSVGQRETLPDGQVAGEPPRWGDFDLEFWGYDRKQVAHALHYLTARLAAVTQQLEAVAQLRIELREKRQEVERLRQQVAHPPQWPGRLVELMQEAERLRLQAEQDARGARGDRAGGHGLP